MPTKNFPIYTDTLLAKSGSSPVGGGNDEHLPVGIGGGYNFKAALKFSLDWSGVTSITSARLYLRTTTKVHATSWGASPTVIVERLTEANWSENDGRSSYDSPAGSGWTASGTDFDSPNVQPGSNDTNWTPGNNESTWYSVDITAIVKAWAPTSIPGGGGASNTGILIRPSANATSETIEFYSRKSAYDPYIVLTYVSNIAPTTTVTAPVNNAKLLSTDLTPTMALAFVEANAVASYDLQVTTDVTWATATNWNLAASTTGLSGLVASIPYGGTALVPGTVYYVRARATDDEGAVGAWSPVVSFRLNRPPTAAGGFGSAFVARVHNLTDLAAWTAVGSHAKPELKFTPTDLDADPITSYEVRISLAGSPVDTDTVVGTFASGAQIAYLHTYALVNGTLYSVAFRAKDSLEWGPWTSEVNFRVRWGEAIYEAPVPASSANWRITFGALAGDGASMATSYRRATGAGGAGATAWSASIPAPSAGAGYINVRVRVASSGTAPTQPALPDMTFTYDASAALPLSWTFPDSARAGLDTNVRRYGQNSIRMEANPSGAAVSAYQDIAVSEDTDYTFSAWAKVEAALVNCTVKVGVYTTAGVLLQEATMAASVAVNEWHRITGHYHSAEGQTSLRFVIQIVGSSGAEGLVWFDASMLDEGTVAGQWTPALIGLPVIIDAQGIIIDGTAGGILRMKTTDGSVVTLGDSGLELDGVPYSTGAGEEVELLRYVPLLSDISAASLGITTTVTANVGPAHTPVITGIPAEAVAVSIRMHSRHSVVTPSHRFNIYDYNGSPLMRAQLISGKVINHYETLTCHYVPVTGRQFDYEVQIGVAGTTVFDFNVTGYWLKELSTGVAIGGGNVIGQGLVFPTTPAENDRFYRTDLDMEFFWNGARWLSTQLLTITSSTWAASSTYDISMTATQGRVKAATMYLGIGTDIWIESISLAAAINSGGTALSASHKWSFDFKKGSAQSPATAIGSIVIDSGASNIIRTGSLPVGALLDVANNPAIAMDVVKTGTPGDYNSHMPFLVHCRVVAV